MTFSQENKPISEQDALEDPSRRDFLTLTACAVGTVGLGAAALPFIRSMNPAQDVLAQATVDIDLKTIPKGTTKVVMWQGKPVFIRHRTKEEIQSTQKVSLLKLIDPQTDGERFKKDMTWLVVVGVCTHLGCIPNERKNLSQGEGASKQKPMKTDDAVGWVCACHGSKYDHSGRVIQGPAPKNLEVPPYQFINNGAILRIGQN